MSSITPVAHVRLSEVDHSLTVSVKSLYLNVRTRPTSAQMLTAANNNRLSPESPRTRCNLRGIPYPASPQAAAQRINGIVQTSTNKAHFLHVVLSLSLLTFAFESSRPRMYYGGQYNESRFYVLHQDFLRYVRNRSTSFNNPTQTFLTF